MLKRKEETKNINRSLARAWIINAIGPFEMQVSVA